MFKKTLIFCTFVSNQHSPICLICLTHSDNWIFPAKIYIYSSTLKFQLRNPGDPLNEPILRVNNLRTTFHTKAGPVHAVDGISYDIYKGKTLGVVGESGCGKSVTSFSIMGLLENPGEITGGEIQFKNDLISNLSEKEILKYRGQHMAMIFQEPMTALNPVVRIGHQIDEQILRHNKFSNAEAKERSIEMLNLVGIPSATERYLSYPHQLSGGMRQRALIAMALSCDPEFLIADEPTTALDVTIQAQILNLIQELQDKLGMAVQFITHDLGVISEVADDILVMYAGRVCEYGGSEEIFKKPTHPYTNALLNSIPKLGHKVDRLPTIDGTVPSLLNRPSGCQFNNRCAFATEVCSQEQPPLNEISSNHRVACHHPVEL